MILLTDGGSTKCDWILLDQQGTVVMRTRTFGLNPAVVSEDKLAQRIHQNEDLKRYKSQVLQVDFYGAGCGTKTPVAILKKVLESYFTNASVTVNEDTIAAVYAATTEPGIVCILGTGSNSCYFDGKNVHGGLPSLGYILMDEASGNYYGKRLIRDYFYNKMPTALASEFEQRFNLNPDTIKTKIYKQENPNMYLASFAEFIFNPSEERPASITHSNGYFYNLISEGIQKFIDRRVMCFNESQHVPIHFVGSIAYFSKDIIQDCLKPYRLKLGNVVRRPIDGLISYYQTHKINSH